MVINITPIKGEYISKDNNPAENREIFKREIGDETAVSRIFDSAHGYQKYFNGYNIGITFNTATRYQGEVKKDYMWIPISHKGPRKFDNVTGYTYIPSIKPRDRRDKELKPLGELEIFVLGPGEAVGSTTSKERPIARKHDFEILLPFGMWHKVEEVFQSHVFSR